MKVLFCGFKYEYGKPELGLATIEYQNFFGTLKEMPGIEASFFAIDEELKALGRDEMNRKLLHEVQQQSPDLLFCMIFQEELKKETIKYITEHTKTKTLNWFTDDHWRLPVFSRYWAPLFSNVVTTDTKALLKYQSLGIANVLQSQWAVNPKLFYPVSTQGSQQYEITFVGKQYGNRKDYVEYLKQSQLPAQGFGKGWDGGVVSTQKMLEIFSSSKINLNFTESYFDWPKQLAKLLIKKEMGKFGMNLRSPISNIQSLLGARRRQIKARIFEIPACGGFMLTGNADGLSDYLTPGKEMAVFENKEELREKCTYYVTHEAERQQIARAGYERVIAQHTYEQRFQEIFRFMQLQ